MKHKDSDNIALEQARKELPVDYCGLSIRNGQPQVILEIDGMQRDVPVEVILTVAKYINDYHSYLLEEPFVPKRNWPKTDLTLDDPTSVDGNENIIEQ